MALNNPTESHNLDRSLMLSRLICRERNLQAMNKATRTFNISTRQEVKLQEWLESLPCPEPLIDHPEFPKLSFTFSNWSGIGPEVNVIEQITGAAIDLTDVEEW